MLLMLWLLQKFFLGNRQKNWRIPEHQILFYRCLFRFRPVWVSLMCLLSLSTSGPVTNTFFVIYAKHQFHNAPLYVPVILLCCAGPNTSFLEPPSSKPSRNFVPKPMISEYTSPICSWLESTYWSWFLSIKIKKTLLFTCQIMEHLFIY